MFGPHLQIDGYGANPKKLKDVSYVYNFLDGLPTKIGMTKIMPPYVFAYNGLKPEDWGVSGIVLIAESHISIHTFVDKGYATFDLFSCKEFDVNPVIKHVVDTFEIKTYEKNLLMRGRHFPKDMVRVGQIMANSRELAASI